MDLDSARNFLRENHRAVLATRRRDDTVQLSPVLVNLDGEGRAIISSRETAIKVKNLRRDPYAQLCAFENDWPGQWMGIDGSAEASRCPRLWIR